MAAPSRRSFIIRSAAALGAVAFAGEALAQVYYEQRPRRRSPYSEPYGEQYAGRCRPMCVQDTSPCDTPQQKAVDGRCSSPTSGSIR